MELTLILENLQYRQYRLSAKALPAPRIQNEKKEALRYRAKTCGSALRTTKSSDRVWIKKNEVGSHVSRLITSVSFHFAIELLFSIFSEPSWSAFSMGQHRGPPKRVMFMRVFWGYLFVRILGHQVVTCNHWMPLVEPSGRACASDFAAPCPALCSDWGICSRFHRNTPLLPWQRKGHCKTYQ
jgi:hypothetical protein